MLDDVAAFLSRPHPGNERIWNEHGLQLEIGCHLRSLGYRVEFERPFRVEALAASTKRPKRELDILATRDGVSTALELKAPFAGRVPETIYDFLADIEFVEAIIRTGAADRGACLMLTDDRQFWAGAATGIYSFFRDRDTVLTGSVTKPTGARDSQIALAGSYSLASRWADMGNSRLIENARYLLVEVN